MKNLLTKTFGRLKVIQRAASNRSGSVTWLCECSCGNTKIVSSDHLTRKTNPVKSCGCIIKESWTQAQAMVRIRRYFWKLVV